jgi:hypothetical protein
MARSDVAISGGRNFKANKNAIKPDTRGFREGRMNAPPHLDLLCGPHGVKSWSKFVTLTSFFSESVLAPFIWLRQASGGDGLEHRLAPPPVATRNGLALPQPNRRASDLSEKSSSWVPLFHPSADPRLKSKCPLSNL